MCHYINIIQSLAFRNGCRLLQRNAKQVKWNLLEELNFSLIEQREKLRFCRIERRPLHAANQTGWKNNWQVKSAKLP
jgi:hypothetical protein